MRRKLRSLAVLATLLLVLVAVGYFVYRIGQINSSGGRSSEAEYSILRNALVSIQSKAEINGELLRGRLLALYQGSDRLLAAQVLDESGLVLWKVPAKSRYFALPNETSSESGYSTPSFSTVVLSTPLAGGMRLTALYTTFRRSDVSKAALPSFIMLLAWFIVLCIALVFLRKDPGEAKGPQGIDVPAIENEALALEAVPIERKVPEPQAPQSVSESPLGEGEESASEGEPEKIVDIEDIEDFEDLDEMDQEAEEKPVGIGSSWLSPHAKREASGRNFEESLAKLEEEVREWSTRKPISQAFPANPGQPPSTVEIPESPAPAPADDSLEEEIQEEIEEMDAEGDEQPLPDELPSREAPEFEAEELLKEFEELSADDSPVQQAQPSRSPSPVSENGKRDLTDLSLPLSLQHAGLEARLAEGVARGGADLALILIHCGLTSDTDPAAAALAVTLRDYIGTADLVFELYKGAFAVVLPSVDLGSALKMSEDLADVLAATYSLYRDLDGEAPVYLGISARSGRTVDAFKLYREASTALHKAYSGGPSKILAFRPKSG